MEMKHIILLIAGILMLVLLIFFISSYLSGATYMEWFENLMGTAKASG